MTQAPEHRYIDSPAALADLAGALAASNEIALDTEFLRERTYYPVLCLVQVATAADIALVDPLALDSLAPLLDAIYAAHPVKVLHAGAQDLELFMGLRSEPLPGLFDTQIAAAFLGFPEQIGYANLVAEVLGVGLSKSHTRSDWTRRPLSAAQLGYAVEDVLHLRSLYSPLRDRLQAAGRLEWALEDMARLGSPERYRTDPDEAWRRVKGAHRLPGPGRAALRRLARWREEQAMARNLPRRWVVPDDTLLRLADARPRNDAELLAVEGVGERLHRRWGSAILAALAAGSDSDEPGAATPPPGEAERALVAALKARVEARAGELGLAASLLAPRAELESLARGESSAAVLAGWRRAVIGEELLALRAAAG